MTYKDMIKFSRIEQCRSCGKKTLLVPKRIGKFGKSIRCICRHCLDNLY